jgi:hypothetical protein
METLGPKRRTSEKVEWGGEVKEVGWGGVGWAQYETETGLKLADRPETGRAETCRPLSDHSISTTAVAFVILICRRFRKGHYISDMTKCTVIWICQRFHNMTK